MRNIGEHDVCMNNIGTRGVRSIGRAQRNFVGARAMLVCNAWKMNIHAMR